MDLNTYNQYVAEGYNHIPVFRTESIDTETALSLYLKQGNKPYSYLFESVEGGEKWGRFSFVGIGASKIIKVEDFRVTIEAGSQILSSEEVENPLDWIEDYQKEFKAPEIEELPIFNGGLVGYFGYEIIRYIEPKLSKINKPDQLNVPDILLMVSDELMVFDNVKNQVYIINHINPSEKTYEEAQKRLEEIYQEILKPLSEGQTNSTKHSHDFRSSFGEEKFKKSVEKIRDYIIAGDVMQVVPSQRLEADFEASPIELYRQLRALNPSPYMYYLNLSDFHIVGSSPEILTRVEKSRKATVRPIAGTRPRGKNQQEDLTNEKDLLADKKEIAEHLMLIDLGRNDLGRIAKTGSVKLTEKMKIERYSHVMHIVSNVECEIKDEMSAIDVLKATFPAGTLSGAPKVRAMEIIDEVEPLKRNIYSGAIGYLSWDGSMDTAIAIRTAVIKNQKVYVQAGAGVVYDSKPQAEWDETMAKAKAIVAAANSIGVNS